MNDPRFQDLAELSRRMTSSLDLRELTEDLVSWAIRETGAVTAAITLWDRERNVLVALTHLEKENLGLKVASGEVYARLDKYPATLRVLEEQRALSVEVGHPTDYLDQQRWLRNHGLSAVMVLPLVSSGEAIGTMEIARADGPFSKDDVSYCQLLCDMAG
ncbi:MAG TPA: GAF domain-containing protein, partial [Thermoleophilaceae bacterium]|nr:GAF domain-containing protein [Thermoleophilaceae bacterium]